MTISQTAPDTRAGVLAHVGAVRASQTRSASDFGTPSGNTALGSRRIDRDRAEQGSVVRPDSQTHVSNPRRMVAVTVALSEPLDAPELDWAGVIAANLRLLYSGTTVEVIDTWRTDE